MTFQEFLLTRRLNAAISRLNRSFAKPSTGSALENFLKFLQVVGILVGAAWVLWLYFEFNKINNQLIIQQGLITRELSTLTLQRTRVGRLEVGIDSSVVRAVRFGDGTFLHRYYVSLKAKNISEETVIIPAIVAEFFIGTMPKDELKPSETLHINLPAQWKEKEAPGKISWAKEGQYAHSQPEFPIIDEELKKEIQTFTPLAVDFGGSIRSGETTDIGLTFLIRSRPDAVAGAVITYWDRTAADSSLNSHIFTNIELLLEAEETPALKRDTSDSKNPDWGAKAR